MKKEKKEKRRNVSRGNNGERKPLACANSKCGCSISPTRAFILKEEGLKEALEGLESRTDKVGRRSAEIAGKLLAEVQSGVPKPYCSDCIEDLCFMLDVDRDQLAGVYSEDSLMDLLAGFDSSEEEALAELVEHLMPLINGELTTIDVPFLKIGDNDEFNLKKRVCCRNPGHKNPHWAKITDKAEMPDGSRDFDLRVFSTQVKRAYEADGKVCLVGRRGNKSEMAKRFVVLCSQCAEIVRKSKGVACPPLYYSWCSVRGITPKDCDKSSSDNRQQLLDVRCCKHKNRKAIVCTMPDDKGNRWQDLKAHSFCGECAKGEAGEKLKVGEAIRLLGGAVKVFGDFLLLEKGFGCSTAGCELEASFCDKIDVDFAEITDEEISARALCEKHAQELAGKRGAELCKPGSDVFPLQKTLVDVCFTRQNKNSEEGGNDDSLEEAEGSAEGKGADKFPSKPKHEKPKGKNPGKGNGSGYSEDYKLRQQARLGEHNGNGEALRQALEQLSDADQKRPQA